LIWLLALVCGGCSWGADEPEAEWRLLFTSERGGEMALWSVRPDGRDLVRVAGLGFGAGGFGRAVVSPDGRRLLLSSDREIVVVDAEGRRRVSAGRSDGAAWSPDGERIVFSGRTPGLSIVDADGGDVRRLTRFRGDFDAAWSPDGKLIAFTREGVGLMLVEPSGDNERVLRRSDAIGANWSPDSRLLSFLAYDDDVGREQMLTVDVASGRIVRLLRGSFGSYASYYEPVAWSPDGTRIAYEEWLQTGETGVMRVVVSNADGSGRRVLFSGNEVTGGIAWAPDGRSLVFARKQLGGSQLVRLPLGGRRARQITRAYPEGGLAMEPVWARVPLAHVPSTHRVTIRATDEGGELHSPFPVIALAAQGATAVAVSDVRFYAPSWPVTPPLTFWETSSGSVMRFNLGNCDAPDAVALSEQVLAYVCRNIPHAVAYYQTSVHVADRRTLLPRAFAAGEVNAEMRRAGSLVGRVVAHGRTVCYSLNAFDRRAEYVGGRVVCGGRTIARDAEPIAMNGRLVAVESSDGAITLVDRRGRVLHRFAGVRRTRRPPVYARLQQPTATLSDDELVVLRGGRVTVYDTASARVVAAVAVPGRAVLAGVADGVVAVVARRKVHLFRIRDGARATVAPELVHGLSARLTNAGLFYASHAKPVRSFETLPFTVNPATVVFVRRAALGRRFP
jgi:Tol biopolymer transport system component